MSALNVFVTPDAVHLWTDGAGYDADGTLLSIEQKIAINGAMPAVIASRGSVLFLALLAEEAKNRHSTFDGLVGGAIDLVRTLTEMQAAPILAACCAKELDFCFAGWSAERGRPEAYLLYNHETCGLPRWQMIPIPSGAGMIQPSDDALLARLRNRGFDPAGGAFDPVAHGAGIMREQRFPFRRPDGREIVAVGGFAQHTMLTRDAITTRVVERWPDRVGEKIAA
ncbi:MAG: hypothetical protein AB7O60_15265 [Variibacter sp.]